MLLMVEKGIRRRITWFIDMQKLIKNIWKIDKNKESLCPKYWDINNLCIWAMSQKLPVNNFEWMEDNFQFIEDFIKALMKKAMKYIFLKVMFNILKNYMMIDLPFLPEKMKIEKVEKLSD